MATGLLFIASAIVFLVVAGAFYVEVLTQVRPSLPPQFRDAHRERYALDTFVWRPRVPAAMRQKYLMSAIYAALAFACVSAALFVHGQITGAAIFAGLFAFAAWRIAAS